MIYVYAILETVREGGPIVHGLRGRPVSFVQAADLTAACSTHDDVRFPPTTQNAIEHERVVEELMRRAALLPVRFGTVLQSEDALREMLRAHHTELVEALEQVRGCDELGVRVVEPPREQKADEQPPQSGREYMQRRLAAERSSAQVERRCEAIHEDLASLCRASMRRQAQGFALTGAYLVARDRVNQFRSRVGDLAAANPDLRVLCTGPWPPYSFAPRLTEREASHAR